MNEITLRNGEVAILTDGTIIMNDDTLIELIGRMSRHNSSDDTSEEIDECDEYDEYDETLSQEDIDAYLAAIDDTIHDIEEERRLAEEDEDEDGIEVALDNSDDEIEFTPEDDNYEEDVNAKEKAYLDACEKFLLKGLELLAKHYMSENTDK